MPSSSIQHTESWYMIIDRETGDEWPEQLKRYDSDRYSFRPDRLTASWTRSAPKAHVTVSGIRLKQDGTLGSLRVNHSYFSSGPPWAVAAVRAERARHEVTEEQVGPGE